MLEKFPRFSIPRYGPLPNTPVNNTELNLAEIFRKVPQLCFNEEQMDFGCLVTYSIHTTFCDELTGDSLSVLLNLRPQDQPCYRQTIDLDGPKPNDLPMLGP